MATFNGKTGIEALKRKIQQKGKQLITLTVMDVVENIVDSTPVGVSAYPSKKGVITNVGGDLKNNWHVSYGVSDQSVGDDNPADVSGSGSIVGASYKLAQYKNQEHVYITNSKDYANEIENGYPDRPEYGWKAKDGYHFLAQSSMVSRTILLNVANNLKE